MQNGQQYVFTTADQFRVKTDWKLKLYYTNYALPSTLSKL